MKIFSGNANPVFAKAVCNTLEVSLGSAKVNTFSDGEPQVEILESVRGEDVYVIQSTCAPFAENLVELLVIVDALRRASARSICAVIPYFGSGRQDRMSVPRGPITAALTCDILQNSGVTRIMTMEVHAGQVQGFFTGPFDHLKSTPTLLPTLGAYKEDHSHSGIVVVSPDAGGTDRARAYARKLESALGIVDKRREKPGVSEVMNVIGDVTDRHVLLVDDMIDTAGTLCNAAAALKEAGALSITAVAVHGVLSGPAVARIRDSHIKQVILTDTIPLSEAAQACDKFEVVSAAPFFAQAISRIQCSGSLDALHADEE